MYAVCYFCLSKLNIENFEVDKNQIVCLICNDTKDPGTQN